MVASVSKYDTQTTRCDCPDWRYREHRQPCKHVKQLLDAIGTVKEWQDKNGRELLPKWTPVIP